MPSMSSSPAVGDRGGREAARFRLLPDPMRPVLLVRRRRLRNDKPLRTFCLGSRVNERQVPEVDLAVANGPVDKAYRVGKVLGLRHDRIENSQESNAWRSRRGWLSAQGRHRPPRQHDHRDDRASLCRRPRRCRRPPPPAGRLPIAMKPVSWRPRRKLLDLPDVLAAFLKCSRHLRSR